MAQTTAGFIDGLRCDIARWKGDLLQLDLDVDAKGNYLQTAEVRGWIEAGEYLLARYEKRHG
jgi:hypothetical protein